DPNNGLTLCRMLAGLHFGHTFGASEPLGNFLILAQVAMIGRRCHDRGEVRPALFGCADAHYLQPLRLPLEPPPVTVELPIISQAVIIAHVETEKLLRSRDMRSRFARPRRTSQPFRESGAQCPGNEKRLCRDSSTTHRALDHDSLLARKPVIVCRSIICPARRGQFLRQFRPESV